VDFFIICKCAARANKSATYMRILLGELGFKTKIEISKVLNKKSTLECRNSMEKQLWFFPWIGNKLGRKYPLPESRMSSFEEEMN